MTARMFALGLLGAAVALAGCGRQGDLERPAPLFGAKAKQDYQEYQRKLEAGESTAEPNPNTADLDRAGDDTNVVAPPAYDPLTTPLPPRTAPISGQGNDPFGARPSGALPDPYLNPNRSQ
jgi:predicted small lipoprotein YifL